MRGRVSRRSPTYDAIAAAQPLVIRGLCREWPLVRAARRSQTDFAQALAALDSGVPVDVLHMPPEAGGVVGYNDALDGFNYRHFKVTATDGGDARCGQVWAYDPAGSRLQLVFESPDPLVLDYPDNVVLSPRGGLVICEDSDQPVQRLYGMTREGGLFEFCRNNAVLGGEKGFAGDYRDAEWAGACFSPDGRWLFANVYSPGFTVAIRRRRSAALSTILPSTLVMTSPPSTPAFSAGLPAMTLPTRAPCGLPSPMASATSFVMSPGSTPR